MLGFEIENVKGFVARVRQQQAVFGRINSDEIKIAFGVFEKHRLTGGQRAGCEGRLCQKKEREQGDQVKGYCKFVSHRHRSFRLFSVLKMFFERFEAFFERFIFLF